MTQYGIKLLTAAMRPRPVLPAGFEYHEVWPMMEAVKWNRVRYLIRMEPEPCLVKILRGRKRSKYKRCDFDNPIPIKGVARLSDPIAREEVANLGESRPKG